MLLLLYLVRFVLIVLLLLCMYHMDGGGGGLCCRRVYLFIYFSHTFTFQLLDNAVVTGVVPSSPRFLPSMFIAHRVQQSHCSSIFHRVLQTHALALSASQFVHKKRSQRIYTSCCCCCCCSHINSHNQVRGHKTGSSHSGAEDYPREKHTQPKVVHAYITADAIHASTRNI